MVAGQGSGGGRRPGRVCRGARATASLSRPAAGAELRGWGARHPGRRDWALRGVDLAVRPGERVLLLGPSGSGKSTLLLALAGLLDPATTETEGTMRVGGADPTAARDRAGILFQDPESQLVMSRAGDDVAFGLENRCVPSGEIPGRVRAALESVGFPYGASRPTDALSGGEQQLLALAGTLALGPHLLLLDEPTANLDRDAGARLRRAVSHFLETRGATLVVVEHRVDDWLGLIDRVVVLGGVDGVVADGPPDRVFAGDPAALARTGVWPPGFAPSLPAHGGQLRGDDLLRAEGVAFRYPGAARDAVGDASVAIRDSEAVALLGANGSGKSTLALLLGGLLRPTRGHVTATRWLEPDERLAARDLAEWPARALARRVGSVFQDPEHQFLTRSVRDELLLGPLRTGISPAEASARVGELLSRLGLESVAEANPFTLSGGEKRRLSVATALAAGPRVLVLDEPTFGQDPVGWTELLGLLAGLRAEGHGICIATHDERFVAALADRTFELGQAA